MDELLRWRDELRREQRWREADALRDCLQRAQVVVEDTPDGTHWHVG
jgi:cysteinyl-tRNA synthetase